MSAGLGFVAFLFLSPSGPFEIGFDSRTRLPRVEQICRICQVAEVLDNGDGEAVLMGFHRLETPEYGLAVSEYNADVLADLLNELVDFSDRLETIGGQHESLMNKSGVIVGSLSRNSLRSCYCEYDDALYGELEAIASPHLSSEEHVAAVMNGLNWEYNPELLVMQVLPSIEDVSVQYELLSMLVIRCKVKTVSGRR